MPDLSLIIKGGSSRILVPAKIYLTIYKRYVRDNIIKNIWGGYKIKMNCILELMEDDNSKFVNVQ